MALDRTTGSAILKSYYSTERMEDLTYQDRPLLAMIPKDEKWGGADFTFAVSYGNPQAVSASDSLAITNGASSNSSRVKFAVTPVFKFGAAQLATALMKSATGGASSFISATEGEIKAVINAQSNRIATELYSSGFGLVGTVSSVTLKVITLTKPEDTANFDIGSRIVCASGESSGALRALGSSANALIVTGVNRSAGTLTFGYNVTDATNGIPTLVAADSLFLQGDREDASSPTRLCVAGLGAWVPSTAPSTSESFFGVDRSVDSRLFGLKYDGTTSSVREALFEAANRVGAQGGRVSHYFMHPNKYAELINEISGERRYVDVKPSTNATVGFRGVDVITPFGSTATVIPDRFCPADKAYGLALDTWKLHSMGKPVDIDDQDGLMIRAASASSKYEVRTFSGFALTCKAPGHNTVITF